MANISCCFCIGEHDFFPISVTFQSRMPYASNCYSDHKKLPKNCDETFFYFLSVPYNLSLTLNLAYSPGRSQRCRISPGNALSRNRWRHGCAPRQRQFKFRRVTWFAFVHGRVGKTPKLHAYRLSVDDYKCAFDAFKMAPRVLNSSKKWRICYDPSFLDTGQFAA